RSATPTTTRWPRASSPPSSANSSTGGPGARRPRLGPPFSATSKAGTIPTGATPRWVNSHPSPTNAGCPPRLDPKLLTVHETGGTPELQPAAGGGFYVCRADEHVRQLDGRACR